MIAFILVLIGLVAITVFYQVISNMKIVGGNELGIVSGVGGKRGFRTISGGRIFVIPFLHRFATMDLTAHTIEVEVDSAIAEGIIPLNVKATINFAIASNELGRNQAAVRILHMMDDWNELCSLASSIIEGHLRDAIATMTPEQVMQEKDTLVAKMINVCKSDLENIGLEITTMNIADVDDHRLEGVDEPDLYIALLKRVQTAKADTQARQANANAKANLTEQQEERRAETAVRDLENKYENLVSVTKVKVKEENQREKVGIENAVQDAKARVAGITAQIEAEKQKLQMLTKKYEAEIITLSVAEKEKLVLEAKSYAAKIIGKARGEIDELKQTIEILNKSGMEGKKTYIIDNFQKLIAPFAETLDYFPVEKISIITGTEGNHEPISAIHPNAIDMERNKVIAGAISEALRTKELNSGS